MDYAERDRLITQIISECKVFRFNNRTFLLSSPSSLDKLFVHDSIQEFNYDLGFLDLPTQDDILDLLLKYNLWSVAQEDELLQTEETITKLKKELYKNRQNQNIVNGLRKNLKQKKADLINLQVEKAQLDYLTAESLTHGFALQYLLLLSLKNPDGTKTFDLNCIDQNIDMIYPLIQFYNETRLGETDYRELARTEPWRSIWNNHALSSLFDKPVSEYSEEQRVLCQWSKLYENIYSNPECPPDEVIEDDDMLDGWLIIESDKRKAESKKRDLENTVSKIKTQGDEMYFTTGGYASLFSSREDVEALNDDRAKLIKKQREQVIVKNRHAFDYQFPDRQLQIQMQKTNLERERFKNVRKGK